MDGAKSAVSHGWQSARPVYTSTLKMPQAPEGQIGRTRLFASFLVFSKMTAPGRGCPVNRSTAHRSPGLACIIHEATCEFGFYVFSYSFCGKFMVNPEMTDCLFDARANSASHLTLAPSARGGPRFSGARVTLSLIHISEPTRPY